MKLEKIKALNESNRKKEMNRNNQDGQGKITK